MKTVQFKFNFGDHVRDRISGIEGKVIGMTLYITGCARYVIQPAISDKEISKLPAPIGIDEVQLELVQTNIVPELGSTPTKGPIAEEINIY